MSTPFKWSFHYLRAFAIVNIIFVHAWRIPVNNSINPVHIDIFREVLFHDSTFYFIFISGFLFAYLSHRVSTKRFYINKFKNILLPYVFLTVTLLLLYANIGTREDVFSVDFIKSLGNTLLYGTASSQFWYIPFILLVFLVAPLFFKLESNVFKVLSFICLFLPMLGTRTGTLLSIGQIIYFLPGFILGIFFAKHYEKSITFIRKINWIFILIAVLTTGFLFYQLYLNQHLILEKNNMLEGVFYVQKSAILALAFLFFEKIENVRIKWLDELAQTSFALFFLHLIIIRGFEGFYFTLFKKLSVVSYIPLSLIFVVFVILISYFLAKVTKRIFKDYSKYLIGY